MNFVFVGLSKDCFLKSEDSGEWGGRNVQLVRARATEARGGRMEGLIPPLMIFKTAFKSTVIKMILY